MRIPIEQTFHLRKFPQRQRLFFFLRMGRRQQQRREQHRRQRKEQQHTAAAFDIVSEQLHFSPTA